MAFLEDHLAGIGRGLDAGVAWCADRCSALADRGRHTDRFEAARYRAERAKEAALEGVGRIASDTKDRWLRHDTADRDSMRRVAIWGTLLVVLIGAGVGLRILTQEDTNPYTDQERGLLVRLQTGATKDQQAPGMSSWRTLP